MGFYFVTCCFCLACLFGLSTSAHAPSSVLVPTSWYSEGVPRDAFIGKHLQCFYSFTLTVLYRPFSKTQLCTRVSISEGEIPGSVIACSEGHVHFNIGADGNELFSKSSTYVFTCSASPKVKARFPIQCSTVIIVHL